ncbi:MAG: ABC transporter ATP-binding protein [Clostridia bacterium]|nr:ABC transporter ATP-binding protein [Clostridia bacterium]
MITLEKVCFGYGKNETLRDVNLHIGKGDFCAIIGANGAGKSTLTRLMRGLLRPTSGRVLIDGQDIAAARPSTLAAKIGYLFQNPDRQLCRNTVREELLFTLQYAGIPADRRDALCDAALERFSLDGDGDTACMSRGERQRTALASALAAEPPLLLLDEPTTGLDYSECTAIMERIAEMNERGVTVVMVCHDMEIVLDFAKTCVVVADGQVLGEGTPADIFYNQPLLKRASLIPPQLIELASRFGGEVGRPTHAEDFAAIIREKRSQK